MYELSVPEDRILEEPVIQAGNVYGSYIHGIFDTAEMAGALVRKIAARRGITLGQGSQMDYRTFKETQYNKMADIFRSNVDMDLIYRIMGMK